jgi:hypothetical protein
LPQGQTDNEFRALAGPRFRLHAAPVLVVNNEIGDREGLAFYTERLDSQQFTLASVALNIADGIQEGNNDFDTYTNKLAAANEFTAAIDSSGADYGSDDIAAAVDFLAAIDSTDESLEEALTQVDELVDNILGVDDEPGDALAGWIVNEDGARSTYIFESSSNLGVLENVQSVELTTESDGEYVFMQATGIPDYAVTITSDLLAWLNGRPRASSDFASGSATVSAGQIVQFGEDIGYDSASDCVTNEGRGYWPPGPTCPTDSAHQIYFPVAPDPTDTECDTGAGSVGYYVNGTSVFNWTDAQTYNNEGVWQTLAPVAEVYDVDICGGHAAQGEYHHHFYSQCLADLVGDAGDDHSPLYGYASDGYPIYGPWVEAGQLALSGWRSRDYDNVNSVTGCGQAGVRSCLLVDQYDPDMGTTDASSNGPDTDGSFSSLSQNLFDTPTGFFFEDWYWDENLTAQGGAYLDQYNGHEDPERGYHYHVTIELDSDDTATPAFPYSVGPRYAGALQSNADANCSTGTGGGGGGGGGMPPPPQPPPPPPPG